MNPGQSRMLDAPVRWPGGWTRHPYLGRTCEEASGRGREVIEKLIDDLDGDTVGTVRFGLDGVSYEIDASKRNAAALRKTFVR